MITYTNVLTVIHISHPTHIPVPEGSVELLSILKHCGWGCMRNRMECTEEEEEEERTTLVWLCSRITYSTETDTERERERERESQYITLWYTWMMHMITYTNVLTVLHSSHLTHIPVPEGSIELMSIVKHCGWGCMRIRMECTEEEEERTTLVWLHSRISYSVERERERESVHNIMVLHGWCTWSHTRMYSL